MRKSPRSNPEHLSAWRIARNSIRNVLGAVSFVSLVAAGGCAAVKPPAMRAPAPQTKPADQANEDKQEDQAEKPKGKTKKPKEEQLKIDIQKCDYYGTCPVV